MININLWGLLEVKDIKMIICKGTAIDGLDSDFDLIQWCGYREISDEENDKILNNRYYIHFLQDNPYIDFDREEDEGAMPGMSDTYYTFHVHNENDLNEAKKFVREEIDEILSK